jgi:cytochrome c
MRRASCFARIPFALLVLAAGVSQAAEIDEASAQAVLKANKCMTCHSVDKKKDGPAYAEVANKYRDDAEAIQKIIDWLSAEHTVEIDGEEDTHPMAKARNADEVRNLANWILSR